MRLRRLEVLAFTAVVLAALALFVSLQSNSRAQEGAPPAPAAAAPAQVNAIPATFNYQGTLRDASGSLVNGTKNITIRIYDAPTAGAVLHTETFTNQAVRDGIFNVVLGDATPFAANVFGNSDRYLGVTVAPDSEMIPRQKIHSVPWALQASTLVSNASLPGPVNVGSYSSGNQYVKVMTGPGYAYRSGLQLRVAGDIFGFDIENDDRLASKGLNIWRFDGGAGAQALFIDRSTGDTTVFSDLKVKAVRDTGQADGTVKRDAYDQSLRRYLVEAPDRGTVASNQKTVPVDESLLLQLCADEDGCSITLGMRNWADDLGKGNRATLSRQMSVAEVRPNGARFLDVRDPNGNTGGGAWDGNTAVNHLLVAYDSCYLTDGEYGPSGGTDNQVGIGLLNWSGGYNSANMVCFLIIDD